MALLTIRDLRVEFTSDAGKVTAVAGLDLSLERGQLAALVGESGSGKSVTALAILGLLGPSASRRARVLEFEGQDLSRASEAEMRALRGGSIGLVFQNPMSCLNPVLSVGGQVAEVYVAHRCLSRHAADEAAVRALGRVGIDAPEQRARQYPHELSGGMKQRVMIAMALAGEPRLLIADEPTTALDVTIQSQILALLRSLQEELGLSILLITHDAGLVAHFADTVHVMYAGRIVEHGSPRLLFRAPAHPYTRALLGALPRAELARRHLPALAGHAELGAAAALGCAFCKRCSEALPRCTSEVPAWHALGPEHEVRCWARV